MPSSSRVVGACQTPTVRVPPWAAVPPGTLVGDLVAGEGVHPASTTPRTATSSIARRRRMRVERMERKLSTDTSVHCAPLV